MTNNVIQIVVNQADPVGDRAALMAEFLLDTTATLEVANEMLDEVLDKATLRIKDSHIIRAKYRAISPEELDQYAPVTYELMVALKDPNSHLFPKSLSFSDRVAAKRNVK